jgi:hypothetical protein
MVMLDKKYIYLCARLLKSCNDHNICTFRSIGNYNIIIVYLLEGLSSNIQAVAAATQIV